MKRLSILVALLASLASASSHADEAADRIGAFQAAYRSRDEAARIAAVQDLSGVREPRVYALLGKLLPADTDAVRRAAADALGASGDVRCAPLLKAAVQPNHKNPLVLEAVFRAMGAVGGACEDVLGKHMNGKGTGLETEYAPSVFACIDALGSIRSAASVEQLLRFGTGLQSLCDS
ncbi:MAG: HEAT repeat domain-containing protein [Planctomycetes bacterium]|nr:HEAT repeat domain-containing protein [Planctomycetota bacterium]